MARKKTTRSPSPPRPKKKSLTPEVHRLSEHQKMEVLASLKAHIEVVLDCSGADTFSALAVIDDLIVDLENKAENLATLLEEQGIGSDGAPVKVEHREGTDAV